jgi:hypothetical protein
LPKRKRKLKTKLADYSKKVEDPVMTGRNVNTLRKIDDHSTMGAALRQKFIQGYGHYPQGQFFCNVVPIPYFPSPFLHQNFITNQPNIM